jgi:hypothetical protein
LGFENNRASSLSFLCHKLIPKWQCATIDQLQKYRRILKKANKKARKTPGLEKIEIPQFGPNWALGRTGQSLMKTAS